MGKVGGGGGGGAGGGGGGEGTGHPPSTASARLNSSGPPTSPVPSMPPAEPVAAVPTDAALIAAWRGGDEPAAAELVRRHARALRSEERRVGKECRSRWSPYH